jgi:hypothetical protein
MFAEKPGFDLLSCLLSASFLATSLSFSLLIYKIRTMHAQHENNIIKKEKIKTKPGQLYLPCSSFMIMQ